MQPHIYVGPWASFTTGDVCWGDAVDEIRDQLQAIEPDEDTTYYIPNVTRDNLKTPLQDECRQLGQCALPITAEDIHQSRHEFAEAFCDEIKTLAGIYETGPMIGFGALIYWM